MCVFNNAIKKKKKTSRTMNPVSRVVCCCKPFKRPFSHITPSKDFGQIVPVTWLTGQSIEAMAHGEFVDFFLLLVGGLKASPLKNMMKVNGDDEIPNINMGKFINWWQPNHQPAICILLIFHYYSIDFPLMFQTTNQSMKKRATCSNSHHQLVHQRIDHHE